METEKNIINENEEKTEQIPYRYENVKESENKPKNINSIEVSESGGDIMKKINEDAENLKSIIDKNDLKIFSKYEDLSVEKLKKLIEEKNNYLLKLNQNKEDSKTKLNNLLKEINKTITENSKILYKESPDPEIIYNLQKVVENKKKELKIAKNINNTFKFQYKTMKSKFNKNNENNAKEKGEEKISNLKNVNKKLQLNINKYKDDTVSKKQKLEEKKDFPNELKIKSEEIRKLTSHKNECYTKIKLSIKSLENLIKEISHLEEMSKKKYEKDGDENLNNKINYWIDLIRSDLTGNQEEIFSKIDKNETNFIKEINKLDLQNNNKRAKSSSFDENQKEINLELSYNLKQINSKNKLLNSNNSKKNYKGIFGKFNYLKLNSHPTMNNKIKLSKINDNSSNFEEMENNRYKHDNDIESIIQKDYEDTTDTEYRILLDKKSQYLETNVRLEKNIREIEKTKKSKFLGISYTVQENEKKLNELKAQNDLLEQEIMNLQQLLQLTIDKEKLKIEIQNDKKNKKIIIEDSNAIKEQTNKKQDIPNKLETALGNENKIKKKMKNNSIKKEKKMKKNRSGYRDDFVPDQSVIETREERLKKIKIKYLNEIENEEKKGINNNLEGNIGGEGNNNENIIEDNKENKLEDNNENKIENNVNKNNINSDNNDEIKNNENNDDLNQNKENEDS